METAFQSIEELIASVLDDIRQKGYSSIQPFSIGKVEARSCQNIGKYKSRPLVTGYV